MAIARGKKLFDKRETIKRRETETTETDENRGREEADAASTERICFKTR